MAKQQFIRDAVGRILGYYEFKDNKIYLLNPVKKELGYYDTRKNQTWQTYPVRQLISREGDMLATLLVSEQNGQSR